MLQEGDYLLDGENALRVLGADGLWNISAMSSTIFINVGGGVSAQTGLCDNSIVCWPNRLKCWANILHVWYFHRISRQGPM